MIKAYLAGPICFYPDAAEIYRELIEKCGVNDIELIVPFDLESDKVLTSREIYIENLAKIRECTLIFADLTPFRGPSMDAGTIWEIGFAYACGKCIYGFNRPDEYCDRVSEDGYSIENFGNFDNLMIAESLAFFTYDTFEEMLDVVWDVHVGDQ